MQHSSLLNVISVSFLLMTSFTVCSGNAYAEGRKIHVSGSMYILDHDDLSPNEYGTFEYKVDRFLDDKELHTLITVTNCVDDEVRVVLTLEAKLLDNDSIELSVDCKLYEGSSCTTDDLDGTKTSKLNIPKDKTITEKFRLMNEDEGDDYTDISFVVKNMAE